MGTNQLCAATEGPSAIDEQNWMVIKPHFNNQSFSILLRASLIAQLVKSPLAMQETLV